jgi:hypothetical protein
MCPLKPLLEMAAVGRFTCDWLAFPAAELIQDRGPTPPIGVFAAMGQQCGDLLPAPLGRSPRQVEGLRHRLTGHRQLQGQTSGMQRGLSPSDTFL